jgi:hypothetical protein
VPLNLSEKVVIDSESIGFFIRRLYRQPPKATARNRIAVPFDLTFAGSTSNICYGVAGVVARAFKCQAGPPKS